MVQLAGICGYPAHPTKGGKEPHVHCGRCDAITLPAIVRGPSRLILTLSSHFEADADVDAPFWLEWGSCTAGGPPPNFTYLANSQRRTTNDDQAKPCSSPISRYHTANCTFLTPITSKCDLNSKIIFRRIKIEKCAAICPASRPSRCC